MYIDREAMEHIKKLEGRLSIAVADYSCLSADYKQLKMDNEHLRNQHDQMAAQIVEADERGRLNASGMKYMKAELAVRERQAEILAERHNPVYCPYPKDEHTPCNPCKLKEFSPQYQKFCAQSALAQARAELEPDAQEAKT